MLLFKLNLYRYEASIEDELFALMVLQFDLILEYVPTVSAF